MATTVEARCAGLRLVVRRFGEHRTVALLDEETDELYAFDADGSGLVRLSVSDRVDGEWESRIDAVLDTLPEERGYRPLCRVVPCDDDVLPLPLLAFATEAA